MIVSKKIFLLAMLITFAWFLPDFFREDNFDKNNSFIKHPNLFYDEALFYNGIANVQGTPQKNTKIKGGIVPHHLLPGHLISDFFTRLDQDIKTIILIGPNHYELGGYKIITSQYAWETAFGLLEPDIKIIDELIDAGQFDIGIDEEVMLNEHSIAGIVPYIKYYLPKANVVPLILSNSNTIGQSDELAKFLGNYLKEDGVLVVASVDFSHYLRQEDTKIKDAQSKLAIEQNDYEMISGFSNDNLDSPSSIITILKIMENLGAKQEIVANTNSGILLDTDSEDLTSYFEILFTN